MGSVRSYETGIQVDLVASGHALVAGNATERYRTLFLYMPAGHFPVTPISDLSLHERGGNPHIRRLADDSAPAPGDRFFWHAGEVAAGAEITPSVAGEPLT